MSRPRPQPPAPQWAPDAEQASPSPPGGSPSVSTVLELHPGSAREDPPGLGWPSRSSRATQLSTRVIHSQVHSPWRKFHHGKDPKRETSTETFAATSLTPPRSRKPKTPDAKEATATPLRDDARQRRERYSQRRRQLALRKPGTTSGAAPCEGRSPLSGRSPRARRCPAGSPAGPEGWHHPLPRPTAQRSPRSRLPPGPGAKSWARKRAPPSGEGRAAGGHTPKTPPGRTSACSRLVLTGRGDSLRARGWQPQPPRPYLLWG